METLRILGAALPKANWSTASTDSTDPKLRTLSERKRCKSREITKHPYTEIAGIEHAISPHKLRHYLFTWLKKQGIDDALVQPYSGHTSRRSLEIYSKLSLADAQHAYDDTIKQFPI